VEDISERKRAEEALRQSEAELRALFASMDDAVMVIDRKGVYRKFAPTNTALLFKPPEELLGKPLEEVFPPNQAKTLVSVIQKVVDTKQPTRVEYDLPIGDHTVKFETAISPLTEDSTLWVAHDITARKQAEEQIIRLNAELEQRVEERTHELRMAQEKIVRQEKLAMLGQLAGGVGHELRNPLGIISNAVYYLKLIQPDADEKVRHYHSMIAREVQTSEKIITDLMDFARLESMERSQVSVAELVQWTLMRFTVPESIKTTLKLPEDLPEVFVDMGQMQQVLGNIVDNACQAIIPPGIPNAKPRGGRITISARKIKGMVAISVKDSGEGITPENMARIFEPLFTTKSKGIGLGLAVSKKLAEANGGRIEAKSELGKGSTFTLYLPVGEAKK
jgi:PAS domain S-box-containing protein